MVPPPPLQTCTCLFGFQITFRFKQRDQKTSLSNIISCFLHLLNLRYCSLVLIEVSSTTHLLDPLLLKIPSTTSKINMLRAVDHERTLAIASQCCSTCWLATFDVQEVTTQFMCRTMFSTVICWASIVAWHWLPYIEILSDKKNLQTVHFWGQILSQVT